MLTPQVSVVFSGGVALGAYQAGAYATLHDHKELRPQHLAGSSIGAVNAALIAGNTMPKAVEALKTFWDAVALEPPGFVPWFCYAGHWPSRHAYSWLSVLHARLGGRAGVFYPRLPALMFGNATSVYDLSPLGTRLEEFIDFKRLNDGLIRVSVVTTDVETGDAVVFDTARGDYIGPNHLLASCGFLPDFSPIEINGRLLGDGGLLANTPVEAVLDETAEDRDHVCFLLDLFSPARHRPRTLEDASTRRWDLLFGNQTRRVLKRLEREHRLRSDLNRIARKLPPETAHHPEIASLLEKIKSSGLLVLHLGYHAPAHEAGPEKAFDFSRASLEHRWNAGAADMAEAVRVATDARPYNNGLSIHNISSHQS
jgi:NTE family protein